jgi:ribonuclease HI
MNMDIRTKLYVDGGAHNNGSLKGMGAYAYIIPTFEQYAKVYVTCEESGVTNNIAEMKAAIYGIKSFPVPKPLEVITDSGYLFKGITDSRYLNTWKKNNWRTASGKEVANIELWLELEGVLYRRNVSFKHIRGHNKDLNIVHAYWNDIVDFVCGYVMQNKIFGSSIVQYNRNAKYKRDKIINVSNVIKL